MNVPLGKFLSASGFLDLEVQNFLLFDQFLAVPPITYPALTQVMGISVWALLLFFIVLITLLKRQAFLIGAGLLILLLSISGVNSLNIGGVGTNYAMAICLLFLLAPAAIVRLFFNYLSLRFRMTLIIGMGILGLAVLIYFAQAPSPTYLFSENIFLMALVMASGFILYTGHAFVSGTYLVLSKLNRDIGIKIGWHFAIISTLFLGLMALVFLEATGDWIMWPLPPFQILLVLIGVIGFLDIHFKIKYYHQTFSEAWIGKAFYLGGFAISLLVLFKAELSGNTPMVDFLHHVFAYSQLGFGLLFALYIWVNFSAIINSGNAIEKIMYNPPFFPYFHMRLGGTIAVLILMVYAQGIIAIQFSTSSTQLSADYYYTTKRPVEASVLYENAFDRYRANDKALYAVSNIYLEQNQPTLALKTLERSFEQNPQVTDILLLSWLLEKWSRSNESVFYLEEGLKYYPENPYLANNLALIYHRMNLPKEALTTLDKMDGFKEVRILNATGVMIAHEVPLKDENNLAQGLKNKINLLAADNKGLATTHFDIDPNSEDLENDVIGRSLIRNYLTNSREGTSGFDFGAQIDSMLMNEDLPLSIEQNLKESGLIFKYKTGDIKLLLEHLNGMAFRFSQDAGFYHAFAGWVLSEQGDFEKAAIEWKQASFKDYSMFTPSHLPYLYFGKMEEEAVFISGTQKVNFPDWMKFDSSGELLSNDTVQLYKTLATLPGMLGKELLPSLDSLENNVNKGILAKEILQKKSHWLSEEEIKSMLMLVENYEKATGQNFYLENFLQAVKLGSDEATEKNEGEGLNPYLTPLVLAKVNQLKDDEKRYEMLQGACQFNKDPILWVTLVRYCRIIGLDQYASANLRLMGEWISQDDLTELQLKFL
ncbi:tetratricopeptide repeat domain protein [Cyclobacterium qasimii M12-11B]|uniref:Tetratricopeptide repeat domain protein n=1 Tax=Cyclobacterium qasimii M12-11B TaxID=641524 RepID=S7WIX0_9BACT|nr:tetratricopeptide repeat domain protein [Cyclobacterium qasimii M12-11B]